MSIVVPCLIFFITLVGIASLFIDITIETRSARIDKLNKELNIKPTYNFELSASRKNFDE